MIYIKYMFVFLALEHKLYQPFYKFKYNYNNYNKNYLF